MTVVTGRDSLVIWRPLGAQACASPASRHRPPDVLGDAMRKQSAGMGIHVGLAEDQVITGPTVPITLERLAELRRPRGQLPAGAASRATSRDIRVPAIGAGNQNRKARPWAARGRNSEPGPQRTTAAMPANMIATAAHRSGLFTAAAGGG